MNEPSSIPLWRNGPNGGHLKRQARGWIDRVAAATGLLAWCEQQMRGGLTILMYHRVLPANRCEVYPLPSLAMSENAFLSQVAWLARNCEVLPVMEALRALTGSRRRKRPLVAITFDDGYCDNATIAASILEANGVRGTFFVTTDFVTQRGRLWFDVAALLWHDLGMHDRNELLGLLDSADDVQDRPASVVDVGVWMAALKRANPERRLAAIRSAQERSAISGARPIDDVAGFEPMTVDQIRALHRAGHEIGSHTVSHPLLPQLSDEHLAAELGASRSAIANWTGSTEIGFCYPNGDFDGRVERAVRRTGYAYACTTRGGFNSVASLQTRLARIDITCQRVLDEQGRHHEIAFRSEVCGLRTRWRTYFRTERSATAR